MNLYNMRACATARPRHITALVAAVLSVWATPAAHAFGLNLGTPDITASLDTTLRYNWAMRTSERETNLVSSASVDEGNWLFDRYDTVVSRLDMLNELDINYKNQVGIRFSFAAWADNNFPDRPRQDPRFASAFNSNYANGEYSGYIKRFYQGPAGEFLDGFVWSNIDLGGPQLNVKAGRLAWLPGEFLFGNGGSVSFSMAPSDGRKSDLSPGSSAKESVLPIGQVQATLQFNPEWALMGHLTTEFRSSRISEGGTFWAVGDTSLEGPQFINNPVVPSAVNPAIPRTSSFKGDAGDVAIGLKWSLEALNGDALGLWYRKFDDKNPTWQNQIAVSASGRQGRAVYAKNIELVGLTYNTVLRGWGTGVELNYRRKMPLAIRGGVGYGSISPALVNDPTMEGPRGNTIHFLVSGALTLNKNAVFDSGSIALQFDANRLQSVTNGASLFNGNFLGGGAATCTDKLVLRNCATRNAASFGVNASFTWQQALPSTDISLPIFLTYGLKGNSGIVGAGTVPEGSYLFRPGLRAEYLVGQYKHQFDLAYTTRGGKTGVLPGASTMSASGLANFRDRNYLSFTYATGF